MEVIGKGVVQDFSLESFESHLIRKKKYGAVGNYIPLLKKFEDHLVTNGKNLDTFNAADVEEFASKFEKPSTANVFLAAIRSYLSFRVANTLDVESYFYEDRRFHAVRDLVSYRKVPRELKKFSLSPDEVRELFEEILSKPKWQDGFFSGVVCLFYFGWRPEEATYNFVNALEFRPKKRYMKIKTAKTGNERLLPWAEPISPHIKNWRKLAEAVVTKWKRYREYLTKNLKTVKKIGGIRVTAKVARRTFETQMRKAGVEQWMINFLLGHAAKIPDRYSDYYELLEDLREPMEEKHYLLEVLEEFSW